jgi:hypothetical protein
VADEPQVRSYTKGDELIRKAITITEDELENRAVAISELGARINKLSVDIYLDRASRERFISQR